MIAADVVEVDVDALRVRRRRVGRGGRRPDSRGRRHSRSPPPAAAPCRVPPPSRSPCRRPGDEPPARDQADGTSGGRDEDDVALADRSDRGEPGIGGQTRSSRAGRGRPRPAPERCRSRGRRRRRRRRTPASPGHAARCCPRVRGPPAKPPPRRRRLHRAAGPSSKGGTSDFTSFIRARMSGVHRHPGVAHQDLALTDVTDGHLGDLEVARSGLADRARRELDSPGGGGDLDGRLTSDVDIVPAARSQAVPGEQPLTDPLGPYRVVGRPDSSDTRNRLGHREIGHKRGLGREWTAHWTCTGTRTGTPGISRRFDQIRGYTERLAAPLSPEDQTVQSMPDVSPDQVAPGPRDVVLRDLRARPNEPDFTPVPGPVLVPVQQLLRGRRAALLPRRNAACITRPGRPRRRRLPRATSTTGCAT